jgi:ribosomal-protein-alanine N-acetyltransferase
MIKKYDIKDKPALIALLKLHVPDYFAASEVNEYNHYLEHEIEDYFVVIENNVIIGAGGINYFPKQSLAKIAWDMIHPDHQGKGIGHELLKYRLELIHKNSTIKTVMVRTSQVAYQFYQKAGFDLEKIEKDFWAKGFDLYQMKFKNSSLT